MNIRIACKGIVEHTDVLDEHIQKQLKKVVAFLDHEHGPATLDMVIDGHPTHAHNEVNLHIVAPMIDVFIHRDGNNLYKIIDEVIDKAYYELHRIKEKHVHDKKNRGPHRST